MAPVLCMDGFRMSEGQVPRLASFAGTEYLMMEILDYYACQFLSNFASVHWISLAYTAIGQIVEYLRFLQARVLVID